MSIIQSVKLRMWHKMFMSLYCLKILYFKVETVHDRMLIIINFENVANWYEDRNTTFLIHIYLILKITHNYDDITIFYDRPLAFDQKLNCSTYHYRLLSRTYHWCCNRRDHLWIHPDSNCFCFYSLEVKESI